MAELVDEMLHKAQARRPSSAEVARRLTALQPGGGVVDGCAHLDVHHDYAEFEVSLGPPGAAGAVGDVVPASTRPARAWTTAPGP